ncbi:MAG: TIGR03905 family TSCPD domain-containing protein [Lachnospiraceae bacterium]
MKYTYKTKDTCAKAIEVELDGEIVQSVVFDGGCDGNRKAVARLVAGKSVHEIEEMLSGITCGYKNTSCGDQLAKAVREAYEHQ